MKKTGLILIGIILLAGCEMSIPTQKVVVENRYSMQIPSFLVKATGLNDEASLQYKNDSLNFYMIVIDEKKEDVFNAFVENDLIEKYTSDFTGYSNLIISSYSENVASNAKLDLIPFTVNKLPAKKMYFDGSYAGKEEFFFVGLIEGKERFYQILVWTHRDKKEKYKKEMDKMMESFIEL